MVMTWDGSGWEDLDPICATCGEPWSDCNCPTDYNEDDEADQRFDCEREGE